MAQPIPENSLRGESRAIVPFEALKPPGLTSEIGQICLPGKTGHFFRGEELVLSDQLARARAELLLRLLGPAAGSDPEFNGRFIAERLNGFELIPGELRVLVQTQGRRGISAGSLEYSCFLIRLENAKDGKWIPTENLWMSGEAGSAYRDGRNRVTELCIGCDTILGNIAAEVYHRLFHKLIDITPPNTRVLFSTNDSCTLLELGSALSPNYREFKRPREFYFSAEEVEAVLQAATRRFTEAELGLRPLLDDRARTILETTLADLSVLLEVGKNDFSWYANKFVEGFLEKCWPEMPDPKSFFGFKADVQSLFAASYLLSFTTRVQSAFQAGLRQFRLQLAYDHGERVGETELRGESKFNVCISALRGPALSPVPYVPFSEMLEAPTTQVISTVPTPSPARALLEELMRTRRASRREELMLSDSALYNSPQMLELMEKLAQADGYDIRKVRPYLRFPEENIVVEPQRGKRWRMDHERFETFVADCRAGNEELGPLARSDYTVPERMLIERIKPTGELAIVFVHSESNLSSVDRKDDTSPVFAAVEALQDKGYFVRTGTPIDIDRLDRFPFQLEQRQDLAHLIDIVWGRLQQRESHKAGIVCDFWMGLDIDDRMRSVLPKAEELLSAGVKHVSIEIEGIVSTDTALKRVGNAQLSVEDLLNRKWNDANERTISGFSIYVNSIGDYVRSLQQVGIRVDVRGLGDPRGEIKFYDLGRFEEVLKAGHKDYQANSSEDVVLETAEVLDSRVAPEIVLMFGDKISIGRWYPTPQRAYVYAAQLELLHEKAVRDDDQFAKRALEAMELGPTFLRNFAEEELQASFSTRMRQARDQILRGLNRLFARKLLGPGGPE